MKRPIATGFERRLWFISVAHRLSKSFRFVAGCLLLVSLPVTEIAVAQQNPVPFINQPLVPNAVEPGGAGFTLNHLPHFRNRAGWTRRLRIQRLHVGDCRRF